MENLIGKAKTTTTPELYKEFFKSYYKEKTKTLIIITTVIGVFAVLFAVYAYIYIRNIFAVALPLGAGIMLMIYPHFSYRRPYNSVKKNKITTSFEFYEDMLAEINKASREEYKYSSLLKVVETKKYLYIYHSAESASVVDKENIRLCTAEDLKAHLKRKLEYIEK